MKKAIASIFLFVLLGLTSTAVAQVQLGVKGGVNISSVSNYNKAFKSDLLSSDIDVKIDNKQKTGFNVGLFAQIDVAYTNFFIQPELLFTSQGAKANESYKTELGGIDFVNDNDHSITLNYFQVPIYLGYKLDLIVMDFIVGAGPYFAYGLWASDDLFDDKAFQRFDAGLALIAGFEISRLQITAGYDLGLTNGGKDKFWDGKKSSSLRNRNFKIGIGYFF